MTNGGIKKKEEKPWYVLLVPRSSVELGYGLICSRVGIDLCNTIGLIGDIISRPMSTTIHG